MPAYLAEAYCAKALEMIAIAPQTAPGPTPLEEQIRAQIREGHQAFFKQRYRQALTHYLTAWGLFPNLVASGFPIAVGTTAPELLLKVKLAPALLAASVQIHRLRSSLGPSAHILPIIDPPSQLAEIADRYGGQTDRSLRAQQTSVAYLRQGELQLARRYAEEARNSATEEQRADGIALTAAIALADGNIADARAAFSRASETYQAMRRPDARAAVEHNLGVMSSLEDDPAAAATRFASAVNRLPTMTNWSVTQQLNPGSAAVTRPIGTAGLPLLMKVGSEWNHVQSSAVTPLNHVTLKKKHGAITVDLANNGAANLELALYQPRVGAISLGDLLIDWSDVVLFTTYLAHVHGFVLPLALGDTYYALGRYDLAASYFIAASNYPYLNLAIERPLVWAKLARTYLAEGDRYYRQQDIVAAQTAYERIVKVVANGYELSGALYSGAFAALSAETMNLLNAPDPLQFDSIEYDRRIVVLQALANLQQIANGINYLGIPDDFIPIHPWRYLQNQARYFANQAIQAERAYLNFKGTAEKEAFTRLTLEQAVAAQKSAVKVEQKKVALAREQRRVAQATAQLAQQRTEHATQSRDDYEVVAQQAAFYDEITALYSAPEGGVHLDPDYAQQLGIQLTYVHERYTGLTGSSDFYYTKDVAKGQILQTMNRSRSKATRDLELRNMERKIAQLDGERLIAEAQVSVADKGIDAAEAQQRLAELRARQAQSQLETFLDQELTPELWDNLAESQRAISRRYLEWATGAAFLMERAYEFEYDTIVNRIRFDYERSELNGLLAADLLLADIDQFSYDRLLETEKKVPVKVSLALADRYPYQFRRFQQTGRMDFQTALEDFDRWNPGTYRRKLRRVEVVIEGLVGADGLHGTLTSSGFSLDRNREGKIQSRMQKPETMILSRFELRGDGFVYASTEEQVLAVFENSGVAGGWVLDLPIDINDIDFRTLTNVHLVLYYDSYYSERVASVVKAELAVASRDEHMLGLALRFQYPDEFYNLQSTGELRCVLDAASLPFNHTAPETRDLYIHLETVEGTSATNVTVTVDHDGVSVNATTAANGLLDIEPLAALRGRSLTGTWTLRIDLALNATAFAAGFGWDKVRNIALFVNYAYTPRGRAAAHDEFATDPLAGFESVDDPGAVIGAGAWSYDATDKLVRQESNTHDPASQNTDPRKPGAMLLGRENLWPARRNLLLRTKFVSDGNGLGVVFRYQDSDNFYYCLMDATLGYCRLGKKVGGVFAECATPAVDLATSYVPGQTYELSVAMVDDALVAALDGVPLVSGVDHSIVAAGRFGFFTWNNPTARFLELGVRDV